ncbi:MAG: ammonium transporter [Opitutae bacterium]|nr:ammonium transporter [Opitutae bacterium]
MPPLGSLLRLPLAGLAVLIAFAAPVRVLAEPTTADLEKRIAGLEAYINNTDPAGSAITGVAGPGHNGWLMVCSALVLFMTLPGLALFYGGLVRKKNVLSVLAQCLGIAGLVTVLWWAVGYSLTFGKSFGSGLLGGSEFFFLRGVTSAPNTDYAYWVSQNVFAMYQLMFAIITPALILGAIAERIKFLAVLSIVGLWMLVVYFPLAHMVWGVNGFMNGVWNAAAGIKAIDFAGGTVVHMSSGWSALVLCLILGPRLGLGQGKIAPHNLVLCMVGTGMLWVGWYGFNAGSALAADGIAANAFTTTTLAAAVAGFVWGLLELLIKGKATVLGLCTGIVAGLVVITPATGFVNSTGAVLIGVLAAIVPFVFCTYVKVWLKYDDALDTFGVHAVGGTLGAVLTGFFATPEVNANLGTNLKAVVGHTLWLEQLKAVGITVALSVVGTALIAYAVKAVLGLRPHHEHETQGLDLADHGEEGYAT